MAYAVIMLSACTGTEKPAIGEETITSTIAQITAADRDALERGVRQIAKLWRTGDGSAEEFTTFCMENYIDDPEERKIAFERIGFYMEGIDGFFNRMLMRLYHNTDLATGALYPVDMYFAEYSPDAHRYDDLYRNKTAFAVALNFPQVPLAEKEAIDSGDRLAWAYARMGDMFTERIPAEALQKVGEISGESGIYVATYNIYMGHLRTDDGRQIFPGDMKLLSHWNLRDQLKSDYALVDGGHERQRMVYQVMKRIISQEIPAEVIDSPDYEWNPYTNAVTRNGAEVAFKPEGAERYQMILNNFHAMQQIDRYTGNTYIDRKFDEEMEVSVEAAEKLFDGYLSSPELREVGAIIAERLGRPLEAYDIWYDGFKARSRIDEKKLSEQTFRLYPTAAAFEKDIPNILMKLGFKAGRAKEIGDRIAVDAARGSGHAWGAEMKGQRSHLRTRVVERGIDYLGYNIAMHELGHCVEQTISLYNVDNYVMHGVPNTSFTEALAFVFQMRDLSLLGIDDGTAAGMAADLYDKVWGLYEICGVSMLDIAVWKWMYANPDATAEQLRDRTIELSKEIWNKYFAPVFGIEDETVLAIYSHMITYPLYLSAYAYGQIIEFQLERHFDSHDFAAEIDRIYRLGRLTPDVWMNAATGSPVSVEPMLAALRLQLKTENREQ